MRRAKLLATILLALSAIAAERTGNYEGSYYSTDGDSKGKLRIVIQKNSDSTLLCKVSFTHEGDQEVSTKPISCAVEGDRIVTEFAGDVDGSAFRAKLTGTATDDKTFEGSYSTSGSTGDDHGKWKASLQP